MLTCGKWSKAVMSTDAIEGASFGVAGDLKEVEEKGEKEEEEEGVV